MRLNGSLRANSLSSGARLSFAERGPDRIDAAVDLALNSPHRQALEGVWMALAVSADGMALAVDAPSNDWPDRPNSRSS
jgi:hypothetical protein